MLNRTVRNHILFTEYETVKRICEPLKKLEILGFFYVRHYHDGNFIDLSTNLEWSEYFLNKYLNNEYPIEAVNNHMLLKSGVNLWKAEPENIIWREGEQYFQYGNGVSIYSPNEKHTEIFCFYAEVNNHSINQFYITHLDTLKKFCDYFVEKMSPVILRAEHEKNLLITPHKYIIESSRIQRISTRQVIANFLSEIDLFSSYQQLSKREYECIKLAAMGNSAKQIAKILNISFRTVEIHLAHAKEKLRCSNLKELIHIFTNKYFSISNI